MFSAAAMANIRIDNVTRKHSINIHSPSKLYFKRLTFLEIRGQEKKWMSNLSHLDDKKSLTFTWLKDLQSYSLLWWTFFSQILSNLCIVRLLWAKPALLVSCSVWVSVSPLTSLWILMCLLHKYAKTISVQQLWSIAAQAISGPGQILKHANVNSTSNECKGFS